MLKVNVRDIKKWTKELRSGKFKQGTSCLQSGMHFYCCLGVGCMVFIPEEKLIRNGGSRLDGGFPKAQPSAPDWLKNINDDFCKKTGKKLSKLNDSLEFDFDEIADLLELVYVHKMLD